MITELTADGFKSLRNFRLSFSKGLNVLVGPNAAGKSNICQALGLLASAAGGPIADYVLSLGGAAAVFSFGGRSRGSSGRAKMLSVSCRGQTTVIKGRKRVLLRYDYELKLALSRELRIASESFRLYKLSPHKRYRTIVRADRKDGAKQGPGLVVVIERPKEAGPISGRVSGRKGQTSLWAPLGALESSLRILAGLSLYCHVVRIDMQFSKAWDIDPHVAKNPSDILEPPTVLPNGRRLSSAVYAMLKAKDGDIRHINQFLARLLPGHDRVRAQTSPDGATRTFSLVDSSGAECPAHSLSDGTVKLLALLVGVLGQKESTSIVEEPENYLHPWACRSLAEFFREHFSDGVCILTTHSETVLNAVRPGEMIVVEKKGTSTTTSPVSRERDLARAIRTSGFGCGYHYVAGSLGGTPE